MATELIDIYPVVPNLGERRAMQGLARVAATDLVYLDGAARPEEAIDDLTRWDRRRLPAVFELRLEYLSPASALTGLDAIAELRRMAPHAYFALGLENPPPAVLRAVLPAVSGAFHLASLPPSAIFALLRTVATGATAVQDEVEAAARRPVVELSPREIDVCSVLVNHVEDGNKVGHTLVPGTRMAPSVFTQHKQSVMKKLGVHREPALVMALLRDYALRRPLHPSPIVLHC